jgi:hypothetical protein
MTGFRTARIASAGLRRTIGAEQLLQVDAGGEGRIGAGQDDDGDGIVSVGRFGERHQLAAHGRGESIPRLGAIDGDDADAIIVRDRQVLPRSGHGLAHEPG